MNVNTPMQLNIPVGPFTFKITSKIPSLSQELARIYADYTTINEEGFYDFCVEVKTQQRGKTLAKTYSRFYF